MTSLALTDLRTKINEEDLREQAAGGFIEFTKTS
jgi:hypothetical protein